MAERLPRVTAEQVLRALRRDGWYVDRQGRRHIILAHTQRPGTVAVPRHKGKILRLGTLEAVLRAADLSVEAFRALL